MDKRKKTFDVTASSVSCIVTVLWTYLFTLRPLGLMLHELNTVANLLSGYMARTRTNGLQAKSLTLHGHLHVTNPLSSH